MSISVETEKQWPIPDGLSTLGRRAADVIRAYLEEEHATFHGGGGRFYTPKEWEDRREKYGRDSLLIITHDGGDHAAAFDLDHGAYALREALVDRLHAHGLSVQQCTRWYSAVYPIQN